MIPPDQEIFEVEKRIALRRAQLKRHAGDAKTRATRSLASPIALLAAAGIGFVLANSFARRQKSRRTRSGARATTSRRQRRPASPVSLSTGAMWLIKAKYGSPVNAAQMLLQKFSSRKAPTSARGDKRIETRGTVTPLRQVRP
jgi:hypothetical protein